MSAAKLRLSIDSRLDRVALMGHAVRGACEGAGSGEALARRLELCVVEAVTNVVEHAYRNRPGHEVVLELALSSESVECSVIDEGEPLDVERLRCVSVGGSMVDPGDVEALPEGGFGLGIIKSSVEDLRYRSSGGRNVLTFGARWSEADR